MGLKLPALNVFVGDREVNGRQVAYNDGLPPNDFVAWFFCAGATEWQGSIIHFTDFRY